MRIFANANYPFVKWRRYGYIISAMLLLPALAAMIYNTVTTGSWLNYGVDFTGGTLVQVEFQQPVPVEDIRSVNPDWQITRFGEANEFVIRMPAFDQEAGQDAATRVSGRLQERFGADAVQVVRTEAVGPTVGEELQQKALIALLISFGMMLVYIAFRFEWQFGVASLVPTVHDLFFTLGVLAVLRTEISIGTIAAILTIVGYSVNDTIVIFDRVREHLAKPRRPPLGELVEAALNETLPRTVITSGTTVVVLLSLYLFGGAVIRDFALVLILGIAIGTYSSMFIAPGTLMALASRWPLHGGGTSRGATPQRSSARAAV